MDKLKKQLLFERKIDLNYLRLSKYIKKYTNISRFVSL